jgi:O-antigen/teichoic acid export membrane protein
VVFFIVLKKSKVVRFRLRFDWPFLMMIVKKIFPFAMLVLLMTFYTRIDSVMLERMLPDGKLQSGIYASAFRLLDAVNHFSYLFAVLLLPIFSRMLKQGQDVRKLVKLSFTLIITPAIILGVASFFYSSEIMKALYPIHDGETVIEFAIRQDVSSKVLVILMVCFICTSANYVFGTLLTANGNLRELNIIAILAVVLSVLMNLILIPRYQAVGSAIASLSTHILVMVAQIIVVKKRMRFSSSAGYLIRLILFVFGSVVLAVVSTKLNIGLPQSLILLIGGCLLVAISVRFFPIKQFFLLMVGKEND